MTASRPWWASDGPMGEGIDPDQDPVEAHRSARRGGPGATDPAPGDRPDLCGVCPVCTTARMLEDVHPELVDHLIAAGRHLLVAVRSLLEDPPDPGERSPGTDPARPPSSGVHPDDPRP